MLGAEAATLGSTVFVSMPVHEPTPRAAEILGHEFVHASRRPRLPRLFMGLLDSEEQLARDAGQRARTIAESVPEDVGGLVATGVRRVSAAAAESGGAATEALTSGLGTAQEQIAAARAMASEYTFRGTEAAGRGLLHAGRAVSGAFAPVLSGARSAPIPGAAGLAERAEGGLGGAVERARGATSSLSDADRSRLAAAEGFTTMTFGQTAAAGEAGVGAATGGGDEAAGALAPGETAGGIGALIGGGASTASDATSQMGELMELIEDRVLAELERRGGRFEGVF